MKKILFALILLSSIASFGQYSKLVTINDCVGWCPTYYIGINDSIVISIKIDSKLTTRNVQLCLTNAPACNATLYPYYVNKLVIKPKFWSTNKLDVVYECSIKVEDGNVIGGIRFVFSSSLISGIEDDLLNDKKDDTDKKYFDFNGIEINNPDSYEGVIICDRKKFIKLN